MLIIDIHTNNILYKYSWAPKHVIYTTKEYWDNYVKESIEWSEQIERKLLYGKDIR